MPLMRSISNHFYGGKTRAAGGDPYPVLDKDVDLLISLKRAVRVSDEEAAAQGYKTRELQAEPTGVIGTRGLIPPEQMTRGGMLTPEQRVGRPRRTGGTPDGT